MSGQNRQPKDEKDDAKATAAKRWVAAVNVWGKLGSWSHHVCFKEAEVKVAIDGAIGDGSS